MFKHINTAVGAYKRQILDDPVWDTFYKRYIDYIIIRMSKDFRDDYKYS